MKTPVNVSGNDAHAIVVGVGTYQHPGVSQLKFTRADAQAINDFLADPKHLGLPKENIQLLLDDKATLVNLKRAISGWLAKRTTPESTVLVFFAGHGGQEADRTGHDPDSKVSYLLPWDADPDDLFSTALANDDFNKLLRLIKARRTVVFLDACHSGGVARQGARDLGVASLPTFERLAEGEGRVVISAAKPNQRSWEDASLGHGIFTHHLLEAFRGKADLDDDGYVSIQDAVQSLQRQVPQTVRRLGKEPQDPYLVSEGSGEILIAVDPEKIARRVLELDVNERLRQEQLKERCAQVEKFWSDGRLKDAEFVEAMNLLKKPTDTFDRSEKLLADNLDALLRGGISVDTYIANRRFIRGETGPISKPEPPTKYCTRCGKPGSPSNRFCVHCGAPLG